MKSNSAVILKDLTIGYNSKQETNILARGLNSSLNNGETVALIGNNGCGKSTLLRTIAGFQKPISGAVQLDGKNISSISIKDKAKLISYVSTEIINVSNMRVIDLVRLGRYLYSGWWGSLTSEDKSFVDYCIKISGLKGFEERLLQSLSDGERQRAMIARALAQDTMVMILDEPTAFLDIRNKYEIIHLLNGLASESGKIIIYSTHDLNIAMSLSDKIWYIKNNSLCDGAPEDLALNRDLDHIFEGSEIKLNPDNGEFVIDYAKKKGIKIDIERDLIFWVQKALHRKGYHEDTCSDVFIRGLNKDGLKFFVTYQDNEIVLNSVYQLIKYLDSIK
jgi:iron complex transport system ATP-binding protein